MTETLFTERTNCQQLVRKHRRLEEGQATTICPLTRRSTHGEEPSSLIHSPFRKCQSIFTDCTAMRALRMQRIGILADGPSLSRMEVRTEAMRSLNRQEAARRTTTCPLTKSSMHGVAQRRLIHSPFPRCRRMTTRYVTAGEAATWAYRGSESMKTTRKRSGSRSRQTEVTSPTTTCQLTKRSTLGVVPHKLIHFQFLKSLLTIMVFTEDGAKDLLATHIGALI